MLTLVGARFVPGDEPWGGRRTQAQVVSKSKMRRPEGVGMGWVGWGGRYRRYEVKLGHELKAPDWRWRKMNFVFIFVLLLCQIGQYLGSSRGLIVSL